MGIKESVSSFGRSIKNIFPVARSSQERPQQNIWDQLDEHAQETLTNFYIKLEKYRINYALHAGTTMRISDIKSPSSKNLLSDLAKTQGDILNTSNKKSIEFVASALIEDPVKRLGMQKKALIATREFWEEMLRDPDKAYDVIVFGKQRIGEISAQIEQSDNQDKP